MPPQPLASKTSAPALESEQIAAFLQQATPFATLDAVRIQLLATRLRHQTIAAGTVIIHQGDVGDACYLLQRGQAEVTLRGANGDERPLGSITPGMLFGEAALLTEARRNATVRATEECTLLVLSRQDLIEIIGIAPQVYGHVIELMRLRDRPRHHHGIQIQQQTATDGTPLTILKDPGRGLYYRLSPEGWFIWQRLDGTQNLRDLALAYFQRFATFAPHAIAEVIGGLAVAGFIEGSPLRAEVQRLAPQLPWWQRAVMQCRRLLEWRTVVRGVDPYFTIWYRRGIHWLYTWPAQVGLCIIAIGGLAAFVIETTTIHHLWTMHHLPWSIALFLIPASFFAIAMHELGHAFTTKAFGREVIGIGLGWYWFGPVAFVDTSDMWLAGRWPRIAVSLAGPYTNLLLAGIAAFIAGMATHPTIIVLAWLFAVSSYSIVLVNLNPLLEYDGYYVLMDWLDRPNLRGTALRWLRDEFPRALRSPHRFRGHWIDCCYGIGSVIYVVGTGAATIALVTQFLIVSP